MNKALTSRLLTISVDNVQFDPEDQAFDFKQESCVYYVFLNHDLIGQTSKTGSKDVQFELTPKVLNDSTNVIRFIAKDHGCPLEDGDFAQIGTISLQMDYFKNIPENLFGQKYAQWITLFDDADDDEFDGELGEDDEELPMIKTYIQVGKVSQQQKVQSLASPKRVKAPITTKAVDTNIEIEVKRAQTTTA